MTGGAGKGRVCRQRAAHGFSCGSECFDDRRDDVGILVTKVAAFAGMRIQSAHDNFGFAGMPKRLRRSVSTTSITTRESVARDTCRDVLQRQVSSGERNAQFSGDEQHDRSGVAVSLR